MAAGFYAIQQQGCISLPVTTVPTADQVKRVADDKLEPLVQGAVTLLLSTKVSWWQTNHHIGAGGGFATTITQKCFQALVGTDADKVDPTSSLRMSTVWRTLSALVTSCVRGTCAQVGISASTRSRQSTLDLQARNLHRSFGVGTPGLC